MEEERHNKEQEKENFALRLTTVSVFHVSPHTSYLSSFPSSSSSLVYVLRLAGGE